MKKESQEKLGKNSQEAQMKKQVKQAFIAVGIGAVTLLLFIVGSYFLSVTQQDQLTTTMALNQYRLGSKALTYAVKSYATTGEQKYYDAYMKELNEDKNRDKALEILRQNDITEKEWEELNHVAELSEGLVPLEEEAMEYAAKGDIEKAQSYVFSEEYEKTAEEINEHTDEIILEIQNRKSNDLKMTSIIQVILQILFITSFVYVIFRMLKTIIFARRELLEPIKKVSGQMEALAQGNFGMELDLEEDDSEVGAMVASISFMKKNIHNMIEEISSILELMGNGVYNVKIEQEYVGEFHRVKDSFVTIIEKMRETMLTLREVAGQIDSGAEQLACAAQDLAEGNTEQAGEVASLVTLVEDMSKNMEQSASEAETSVQTAAQAGVTLREGNAKMQELKQAIEEINRCSEQIQGIIGTIEDIASETNLLSLNAAIEAARAGEAGKGFAVVADQVKSLAEESAKAAGQTTKLIERTVEAVNTGITIADESAANMELVMEGAAATTDKMKQIAEMLDKNVEHMHEFNGNISHVSSVVDNNSATAEETAAVSEEQKAQSVTLVELIDRFEI